ncbi:hypothetical protein M595_3294 [Lyngbya aestuarii BL J]|uniref:Uncharacterized protein n=2 Tax=Lyngbya aestuarii TaxID=118322 RepID=U7QI46_9CYAN|nr:hypothetical protein M595_3294 [Lyngbya aestuarii BL J]
MNNFIRFLGDAVREAIVVVCDRQTSRLRSTRKLPSSQKS